MMGTKIGLWAILFLVIASDQDEFSASAKDSLIQWARRATEGYQSVNVRDLTTSWRDGLAFNAVLHRYRPDLIDWRDAFTNQGPRQRLHNAFDVAERQIGVAKLLDPKDVDVPEPDEKSMMAYISSLRDALGDRWGSETHERSFGDYRSAARELLRWIQRETRNMEDGYVPRNATELQRLLAELDRFKAEELPRRQREKQRLEDAYIDLERNFGDSGYMRSIEEELAPPGINRAWNRLIAAMNNRDRSLSDRERDLASSGGRYGQTDIGREPTSVGGLDDSTRRLDREIGLLNEKLDVILNRIEDGENRARTTPPRVLQEIFDGVIDDLIVLETPIEVLFKDVETLKANRHPLANDYYMQVFGLHQRRIAYLERCGVIVNPDGKVTGRRDLLMSEGYTRNKDNLFRYVEECIDWVERMLKQLSAMTFVDDIIIMEDALEKHKLVHRDVMDFRHKVDECIRNQSKVSAEDSPHYVDLLRTLEDAYAQLREVSTGRMLDLDSLVAFMRAAQLELIWIKEREEIEVGRNWSDLDRLDLLMLQNYYKQLMYEIELREEQFTAVHNQGAALLNQGHPAVDVLEAYVSTLQMQWDWLLGLTQCLEMHLRDAVNYNQFLEDAKNCDQWMESQLKILSTHYERSEFTLEEGETYLKELEEIRQVLERYHGVLSSLVDRSRIVPPMWQRGIRVDRPTPVAALCKYQDRNVTVRKNDECILNDNTDIIRWVVRTPEGSEGNVPSVVFRFPPPDDQLISMLKRLRSQFDRLRRLWAEKERMVRFNMLMNTMRTIQGWDSKTDFWSTGFILAHLMFCLQNQPGRSVCLISWFLSGLIRVSAAPSDNNDTMLPLLQMDAQATTKMSSSAKYGYLYWLIPVIAIPVVILLVVSILGAMGYRVTKSKARVEVVFSRLILADDHSTFIASLTQWLSGDNVDLIWTARDVALDHVFLTVDDVILYDSLLDGALNHDSVERMGLIADKLANYVNFQRNYWLPFRLTRISG